MATLSSPTASTLVTSVRAMLRQPNPANSFWSDEELLRYLNEAVRVYFAEVTFNNEGQFLATADLNMVGGTETIALPTDCFEVRAVYRKMTDGYVAMAYVNDVTRGFVTAANSTGDMYIPSYYFRGNNLVLRDAPEQSETAGIRLEYVQFPDTLVNGGDALSSQISPIFKQVVEMYAVYKAKMVESLVTGVDTSALAKQNLNELYVQFKEAIKNRTLYPKYTVPYNPEGEAF